MEFKCQKDAMNSLETLARSKRQSVVIEGPSGSGKTYLAKQYANMLEVTDFISVSPKVNDIRSSIDEIFSLNNSVLVCIENLDLGVVAASYTILKFLEEPLPNVYVVVTCRNIQNIPDTIVSRSAVVTTCPPTSSDLNIYASSKDDHKFKLCSQYSVWRCCNSLQDVDSVLSMTSDQLKYYDDLVNVCRFSDSVSNIVWSIGHYPSGQESNLVLVIRSIMNIMNTPFVTKCGVECLRDIASGRIAQHAILSKFIFNAKYCE